MEQMGILDPSESSRKENRGGWQIGPAWGVHPGLWGAVGTPPPDASSSMCGALS